MITPLWWEAVSSSAAAAAAANDHIPTRTDDRRHRRGRIQHQRWEHVIAIRHWELFRSICEVSSKAVVIEDLVADNKPDIILLQEHWLTPAIIWLTLIILALLIISPSDPQRCLGTLSPVCYEVDRSAAFWLLKSSWWVLKVEATGGIWVCSLPFQRSFNDRFSLGWQWVIRSHFTSAIEWSHNSWWKYYFCVRFRLCFHFWSLSLPFLVLV